jgi:hypothetical protein
MSDYMNGGCPPPDDAETEDEVAPFEAVRSDDDIDIELPGELAAVEEDEVEEAAESRETSARLTARQRCLAVLEDSEGPQTLQQIIQGSGLNPKLVGVIVVRAVKAGLLQRVDVGTYALPPPPEPAEPPAPPRLHFGFTHAQWLHAMHAWRLDPSSWPEKMGPKPGELDFRGPIEVVRIFNKQFDEIEKAAAATLQNVEEADNARLWDQAMRACGANVLEPADIGPLVHILKNGIGRDARSAIMPAAVMRADHGTLGFSIAAVNTARARSPIGPTRRMSSTVRLLHASRGRPAPGRAPPRGILISSDSFVIRGENKSCERAGRGVRQGKGGRQPPAAPAFTKRPRGPSGCVSGRGSRGSLVTLLSLPKPRRPRAPSRHQRSSAGQ